MTQKSNKIFLEVTQMKIEKSRKLIEVYAENMFDAKSKLLSGTAEYKVHRYYKNFKQDCLFEDPSTWILVENSKKVMPDNIELRNDTYYTTREGRIPNPAFNYDGTIMTKENCQYTTSIDDFTK